MDSIEKRNSITYDAEKDELKIITYYDERRYKEIRRAENHYLL